MLKSTSLTIARWLMLLALEHEPITVAQAARLVGIRRQSAQRLVDVLVETGLVEFKPNRNHRRAMLACVTNAGLEKLRQAEEVQSSAANNLASGMDVDTLTQALGVLRDLRCRLREGTLKRMRSEGREMVKPMPYPNIAENLEKMLTRHGCGAHD